MKPFIVTLIGLPGSGKSTLARQLQPLLGGVNRCYVRQEPISGIESMDNVGRTIQTRMLALDNLTVPAEIIIRDQDIYSSSFLYGSELPTIDNPPQPADMVIWVNTPLAFLKDRQEKRGRAGWLDESKYLSQDWQDRSAYTVKRYQVMFNSFVTETWVGNISFDLPFLVKCIEDVKEHRAFINSMESLRSTSVLQV